MAQGHTFVFTLNNYDDDDISRLQSPPPSYLVLYGRETAPSTGTPHLQGVLWRKDDARFKRSTARNIIGKHAWVDKSYDLTSAIGYCLKDGDWWTNYVSASAIPRLKEQMAIALTYGSEPSWLGLEFWNCYDRPDFEPFKAAYDTHKYNMSLPAHK